MHLLNIFNLKNENLYNIKDCSQTDNGSSDTKIILDEILRIKDKNIQPIYNSGLK